VRMLFTYRASDNHHRIRHCRGFSSVSSSRNCVARPWGTQKAFTKLCRSNCSDSVSKDRHLDQLMRLPGSINHKAQRPSSFLSFNAGAGLITLEMIQAVIEDLRGQLGFKRPLIARQGPWTSELMERFLRFYSIDYLPPTEIAQGLLFVLNPCPLNADHIGSSPAVVVTKGGWAKFCCKHQSCGGGKMRWKEFRVRLFGLTGKFFLTKGSHAE